MTAELSEQFASGRHPFWPGKVAPDTASRLARLLLVYNSHALAAIPALISQLTGGATAFGSEEQSEVIAQILLQDCFESPQKARHVVAVMPTAGKLNYRNFHSAVAIACLTVIVSGPLCVLGCACGSSESQPAKPWAGCFPPC